MKLAILVTEYPAVSHTFIDREILELCNNRIDVYGFSLNKVPPSLALPENSNLKKVYEHTRCIKSEITRKAIDLILSFPLLILKFPKLCKPFMIHVKNGKGLKFFQYLFGAIYLGQELRKDSIPQLHVHFANAALNIALLTKVLFKIRVTCTIHGPVDFEEPDFNFLTSFADDLDGIRFISEKGRGRVEAVLKKRLGHSLTLACGIFTADYPLQPLPPKEKLRLLSVIRLSEQKNPLLIVEVAKELKARNLIFEWIIIGGGPLHESLVKKIKDEKMEEYILLRGQQDPEAVKKELKKSHICVLVSRGEGTPVFIMEAMASGRICVSTDVGNLTEIIIPEKTGFLSQSQQASDIAHSIIKASQLLNDSAGIQKLLDTARLHVENKYDITKNMAQFIHWLEEMP